MKLLIDRGADVEAPISDGRAPLHLAAVSGHETVAQLLIDRCADVTTAKPDVSTPLAAEREAVIAYSKMQKPPVIKLRTRGE